MGVQGRKVFVFCRSHVWVFWSGWKNVHDIKENKNEYRASHWYFYRETNMDVEEERSWIEKRNHSKLSFSKRQRHGIIGRGNPLLARRKIRTAEDLEKKSKKLFGM